MNEETKVILPNDLGDKVLEFMNSFENINQWNHVKQFIDKHIEEHIDNKKTQFNRTAKLVYELYQKDPLLKQFIGD